MNADEILYDKLSSYFDTLSKIGYRPDAEVDKLIIHCFVNEFSEMFYEYLTTEDYSELHKLLSNL
jgi:hypothetical protein